MSDAPAPTRAEGAREDFLARWEIVLKGQSDGFVELARKIAEDQRDAVASAVDAAEARAARAEAEVARLSDLIAGYEEAMADKRRLARMIDVAMHGEEGAALQPSLCDLVGPASDLRKAVARLTAENERMREALKPFLEAADDLDDNQSGHLWERAAAMSLDADHLRAARAALQGGSHAE